MERKSRIQTSNGGSQFNRLQWMRWPGGMTLQLGQAPPLKGLQPIITLSSEEKTEVYDPLAVHGLAIEFAKIKTPDQALAFSNSYGLLGLDQEPARFFDKARRLSGIAEPAWDWLKAVAPIALVLELWGMVDSEDSASLRRRIRWERAGVFLSYEDGQKIWIVTPVTDTGRWLEKWKRGDLVGPALHYIATLTNRYLRGKSSAMIELGPQGKLTSHSSPVNLHSALWLQVADIVTGKRRIRPCSICKDLMDVTDNRGHKAVHSQCSLRERMRRYRRKGSA